MHIHTFRIEQRFYRQIYRFLRRERVRVCECERGRRVGVAQPLSVIALRMI